MAGDYHLWNSLIAKRFFNPEMEGREVILFIDEDTINEIGEPEGKDFQDFIDAVKAGPMLLPSRYRGDIFKKAYGAFVKFNNEKDRRCPPYLSYLAFFVYAATINGEYNPNSYYPKLAHLLGEGDIKNMSQKFSDIDELWADLERWSQEDKEERYGRFVKRRRGGYAHVGLVYAQTILSERERKALPDFFSGCDFDPTDPPAEDRLRFEMIRNKQFFEQRTRNLLSAKEDLELNRSLKDALFDLILSDLEQWDGAPSGHVGNEYAKSLKGSNARICLEEGIGLTPTLRLKLNLRKAQFPDQAAELMVKIGKSKILSMVGDQKIVCSQANQDGWSSQFRMGSMDGDLFPVNALSWESKYVFEDYESGIKATFRPSLVRTFLPGDLEGTSDKWVETQTLKGGTSFLIACHNSFAEKVMAWGNECADSLNDEGGQNWLPGDWSLFYGENAKRSSKDKDLPLYVPQKSNIKLVGGLNLRGNEYLEFSPPTILVEGPIGSAVVKVNGQPIEAEKKGGNTWRIPRSVGLGAIKIEVEVDGKMWERRISLVAPTIISTMKDVPKRDGAGSFIKEEDATDFIQGVLVNEAQMGSIRTPPRSYPTYLSNSVVFIGRSPGLIASWPDDGLPNGWGPVWALAKMKKRWQVHFCGTMDDLKAGPSSKEGSDDRRSRKAWKEYVYVNRERTKGPNLPKLKKMWEQYQEVAKYVR